MTVYKNINSISFDNGETIYNLQGSNITVDSTLSSTSENPVQNKIIYNSMYYKAGDKYYFSGSYRIGCFVYGENVCFSIILDKPAKNYTSFNVTKFQGAILDYQGNYYATSSIASPANLLSVGSFTWSNVLKGYIFSGNYRVTNSSSRPSGTKVLCMDITEFEITFN